MLENCADHMLKPKGTQNTALHISCQNGDYESVRLLVEAGAEIHALN